MLYLSDIFLTAVYLGECSIIGGFVAACAWVLLAAMIFKSFTAAIFMRPYLSDFPVFAQPRGWFIAGALIGALWAALSLSNDKDWTGL